MPLTVDLREFPTASPPSFVGAGSHRFDNYSPPICPVINHLGHDSDDDDTPIRMPRIAEIPSEQWRWSTSTFGYDDQVDTASIDHASFADHGDDRRSDGEEDFLVERQHIPQLGRSLFDLAPSSTVNIPTNSISDLRSNLISAGEGAQQNRLRRDMHSVPANLNHAASAEVPVVQRSRSLSTSPQPSFTESMASHTGPTPPSRSRFRSTPPPFTTVPHAARLPFSPSAISPITEGELLACSHPLFLPYMSVGKIRGRKPTEIDSVDPEWSAMAQTTSALPYMRETPTPSITSGSLSMMSSNTAGLSRGSTSSRDSHYSPRTPPSSHFGQHTPSSSHSSTARSVSGTLQQRSSPLPTDADVGIAAEHGAAHLVSREPVEPPTDRHTPPLPGAMAEAQNYEVYGEDCKPLPFGSLYPTTKTNPDGPAPRLVAFFVRVLFCGTCHDFVRKSVNTLDRAALDRDNITVIIVANGPKEALKGYRKSLKIPFNVYSDAPCGLYSLLGFRRGLDMGKMIAPSHKPKYNQGKLPIQIAKGFLRALIHFPSGMGGNIKQLGGEIVINQSGECEYIHRMTHPRDHMEAADVIRAAGCFLPASEPKFKPVVASQDKKVAKTLRALEQQIVAHQSLSTAPTRPPFRSLRPQNSRSVLLQRTETLADSQHSDTSPPDTSLAETPLDKTYFQTPSVGSVGSSTVDLPNQTQDVTLERFLAEYLNSSERIDRGAGFSAAWPQTQPGQSSYTESLCDLGLCDIMDYVDALEYPDGHPSVYKGAGQDTHTIDSVNSHPVDYDYSSSLLSAHQLAARSSVHS